MVIKTSDPDSIKPFLKNLPIPKPNSHKGQNGRILIIGGSTLFHAASIWAAEIASHFVDMVHYSSTEENNEILLALKKKFRNGMVVHKKNLIDYVKEDDAILIGPGMVRGEVNSKFEIRNSKFQDILNIEDEATYTYYLTKFLLENFPEKKFVIDAGALQMMKPEWLLNLKAKPIVTPHMGEFKKLFASQINKDNPSETEKTVEEYARKFNCIILLKAVKDYISDGEKTVVIEGGNAGLTKGGTGDILAGLATSLYAKDSAYSSAVLSSFILKETAEKLFLTKGYWYNISDIIEFVPAVVKNLV